jgi:hypothetical protein
VGEIPEHLDQSIPLGGGLSGHAVRRRRSRRRSWSWPLTAVGLGVAAAVAGVLLASTEPQAAVGMDAGGYSVAGQRLTSQGAGAYEAASGTALVISTRGGRTVAGASATMNGRPMTGRCETGAPAGGESCTFTLAGESLAASDERTAYGWHRRYSDGRTVAIHVPGDPPPPVPFALGR